MDVKPWWMQRTFWAFLATVATVAGAVIAGEMSLTAGMATLLTAVGTLTARIGGVAAAQNVVDNLPPQVRNAVEAGVASEAKLAFIDKLLGSQKKDQ